MSAAAQTAGVAAKPSPPKPKAWRELARLIPYFAPYKGQTVFGLFTLIVMGLVGAIPPLIIGAVTDLISGAPRPLPNLTSLAGTNGAGVWPWLFKPILYFYRPGSGRSLAILCLGLILVVIVKGIFSFASRWILIGMSRDIEFDLRNDLLAKLVQLEPAFYVRNRTGELMSRCTNDLNAVRMVLGPGIMYSGNTIVNMAIAIALMVKFSPMLTLEVLLPVPVVAVAVWYFGRIIHGLQSKIQAMLAALSAKAQENLTGIRVVRAFGQEESEIRTFDVANRRYVDQNMRMIRAWSMFFPMLQFIIGFSFLFVLWEGSRIVIEGRISIGALMAFYTYLLYLIFPMVALGFVTNIFQRGAASMTRLNFILDSTPEIRDREAQSTGGQEIRGEIEFRNLSFAYPTARSGDGTKPAAGGGATAPNELVLRNINLKIPAGSTVAIVGPTGSGKSTLASLIARLWEAPEGTLFIDGRPIRDWPLADLRRAIGYVQQDAFLFSETIKENIAFGMEVVNLDAVEDAAQISSISGDISDFPERYDTIVGERGITLSGGQKQRTTLARAVIRDPKILILDDAFASVDTDTEERILQRIDELMHHRTTVLVSHRCSTVRDADLIVVLRDGQIIERGTHEELLGIGGYYAELYQKQLLEEELAHE